MCQYEMLCSETPISDRSHISELLVPGFGRPVSCRDRMPQARGMADGYGAFRQPKFECSCYEMLVFRACAARQNFYMFSLYRNPDQDDRIYNYLLTAMAAVQSADACASFLFVGDLNGIIRNVWVLLPRTVMVLRPSISPLCQVVLLLSIAILMA